MKVHKNAKQGTFVHACWQFGLAADVHVDKIQCEMLTGIMLSITLALW
jgi:hypothetical protein